jgi:hypothetical protein
VSEGGEKEPRLTKRNRQIKEKAYFIDENEL